MIILGIHPGNHDASAALLDDYRVLGAVQLERLNRAKGSGVEREAWAWPCVDELLSMQGLRRSDVDAVAFTRASFPRIYLRKMQTPLRRLATTLAPGRVAKRPTKMLLDALNEQRSHDPATLFDIDGFLADSGFRRDVRVHWCNHHFAHAITALFFTDWDDALIYTADGHGDNVCSSARSLAEGKISCLFGGEETLLDPLRLDSLGFAYGFVTQALGFRMLRHEGKVTGLAAYGEPTLYERMAEHFSVDGAGRVWCDWLNFLQLEAGINAIVDGARREDAAASIQMLVEQVTLDSLSRILRQVPHRRLGLAGGLFANVKLNRFLGEHLDLDEIFIAPPMGDEGLSLGAALHFLLDRDGLATWLGRRYRLADLYWGRDYDTTIDHVLAQEPGISCTGEASVEGAAARLANGEIGAVFSGRMEFGPRALGARSILANPSRRAVHDELNRRLSRTEFMPFAPVVTETDAARVFEITSRNTYACRFMTITTEVRPEWRERIQAVVHVDGSARPQIARREANPLYHDILVDFTRKTGIPALVNTSFNVHEEPIVNRPEECVKALTDGRIDFVVTKQALYTASRGGPEGSSSEGQSA
jgi:carbamoyltransferase